MVECPDCGTPMFPVADFLWHCPEGCGRFIVSEEEDAS